jgi:solute carrier family 39 (zinc transporter), member 1/2/3
MNSTLFAEMADAKPQCGTKPGEEAEEYDLPLHVAALFMVLIASAFGAGFPVVAKRVKWMKIPPGVFFACKHFGTGVLVATAFVHLLPTAFGSLTDPCLPDLFTDQYPAMPGVIMMASMFALFVIEMYLNAKTGGHSHGGPTGSNFDSHSHNHNHNQGPRNAPARPPRPASIGSYDNVDYEKKMAQRMYEERERHGNENPFEDNGGLPPSEMPPWFVVFYEQYVRQRLEMMNLIRDSQLRAAEQSAIITAPKAEPFFDAEGQTVDPEVYRRMNLNITLLEGGILFHSVFVGMTISITTDGFIILLVAILFHQMFEGLGLGSRIAAVPYPKGSIRPWVLVLAFGTTCPIGQAIGLATRGVYDPNSAFGLIIVGVFNAM